MEHLNLLVHDFDKDRAKVPLLGLVAAGLDLIQFIQRDGIHLLVKILLGRVVCVAPEIVLSVFVFYQI